MEQDQNQQVNKNVALFLTDGLKTAWRNFIDKFQESFDLVQLDSVLSLLRELDSANQNPTKKNRLELLQKEDGESQDNNKDNSSSLEKKVFGNHLLASSVFQYLPHSDLLSCRLMNSYCNEYATEILLNRDLKIEFKTKFNRFYLSGSNWKSLDMFTELLKRSKNFPCNKFLFKGGNLGNDDAQRFFSFYGSSITFIEISFSDGQVYNKNEPLDKEKGFSPYLSDSRVIGMILSQHLPNLEHLNLGLKFKGNYEWSGLKSLLFPPKKEVKLPNLKKLVYDSNRRGDDALLRQLLLAATNLTSFEKQNECVQVESLDNFIVTGKVNCISALSFPAEAERLEKLEEMIKHEPKLTHLYLNNLNEFYDQPETWKIISIILTNLLESCKNSLNKIDDFDSLGFLRQLQLPILQNVTSLHLQVLNESEFDLEQVHDYSFAFLPRGATFSRNFPRLRVVMLSLNFLISDEDAAEWWTKCFPTDEIVPSVTTLCIGFCPLLWIEKLSQVFPNLKFLSVSDIKDFPNFSKIIWTSLRKLKILMVTIDTSSPLNSHPALDSSFTGLSPEVCKKLEIFSSSMLESMAENYMENEPSLLNLTELHTLEISLEFSDASNYEFSPMLTLLSGICAFKPLENLKQVNIKFSNQDLEKMPEKSIMDHLELLIPYKVKIQITDS